VSIQDVAAAAEVSIATVSRVLNNPSLVAEKTSARVQAAIDKLGYVPNAFAQGLITKASRVLGIALPDIHGEFYSELLRGADAEARRLGYHLIVSSDAHVVSPGAEGNANGSPLAAPRARTRNLAFGLVDGLAVMITEPNESLLKEARALQLPVVVLDLEIADAGVDCILVDNAVGTRQAVAHLLEQVDGTRLFFVGGPAENFDTRRRAEAFKSRLKSAGVKLRPDQLAFGEYNVEWGRKWALARGKERLIGSGILAGNDEIGLGVLHTCQDLGLDVPRDVSIVGFDDTRLAGLVRPSLSSVRIPLAEIGAAAIAMLAKRVEDPARPGETVRLETGLVVRESSGGAKAEDGRG
jgi:LacI family transcriptional regulator